MEKIEFRQLFIAIGNIGPNCCVGLKNPTCSYMLMNLSLVSF